MMHVWGSPYGMGGFFTPVLMALFWVMIVVGIVLLIKHLSGETRPAAVASARLVESSAIEILKERYARGEIDKDEYEEKFNILST